MKKIVVLMYIMVPLRVTLPLNIGGYPIPSSMSAYSTWQSSFINVKSVESIYGCVL
jgi:hypothetical protein